MISDWIRGLLKEDYVLKRMSWDSINYSFYSNQKENLQDQGVENLGLNNFLSVIKTSPRFNVFLKYLENIKREFIYKSECHGITHNERVALFSFYLAEKLGLNDKDLKIALYGAIYHDIGRHNDLTDDYHGLESAKKLHKLNLNLTEDEMNCLKAIVTAHSVDDEEFYEIAYENKVQDYERCETLFKILKDSDGLDRVRLGYPVVSPRFIRNREAKEIILAAYELYENFCYLNKDNNQEKQ